MDIETQRLVEAWILRFCEAPVLIDKELMRRLLAEQADKDQEREP